jgi:ribonuclease E
MVAAYRRRPEPGPRRAGSEVGRAGPMAVLQRLQAAWSMGPVSVAWLPLAAGVAAAASEQAMVPGLPSASARAAQAVPKAWHWAMSLAAAGPAASLQGAVAEEAVVSDARVPRSVAADAAAGPVAASQTVQNAAAGVAAGRHAVVAAAVGAPLDAVGLAAAARAEGAAAVEARRAAEAEVPQQAARASAVAGSASASACRRDQGLPSPGPPPAATSARAMACLQSALPSERWWQAVQDEGLS